MARTVTLMPGDGIGPEVAEAAQRVIAAAGMKIDWDLVQIGAGAIEQFGTPLPPALFRSLRRTKVGLKGPTTTPVGRGHASANVALRKTLNLFANLRPVKNLPGVDSRYDDVDLVIVRENTEDVYAGVEHEVAHGVVECAKIITWDACTRIARFAFDHARATGRKRVTAVHKANIMKMSDGLYLAACRKVAKKYPKIAFDDVIVDALCMKLVMHPGEFDVLLCENLYGDIVSDLCAGLVGGLGMVPGANYGTKATVFETVHGSAPDIAGKGIANPVAMVLCAEMMLRHLNEKRAADRVRRGVERVLQAGKKVTPDIGGKATTKQMTDAIIAAMK